MDIILVGKTLSGKSTVKSVLIDYGYRPILEYTTRPMRKGEENGVDYHFTDDTTFDKMETEGQFIESRTFNTVHGIWKYGALKNDFGQSPEGVIIMGPEQLKQVLKTDADVFIAFLDIPDNEVINRVSGRGDVIDEVRRRLDADRQSYEDIRPHADYVIDTSTTTPDTIAGWIIAAANHKI